MFGKCLIKTWGQREAETEAETGSVTRGLHVMVATSETSVFVVGRDRGRDRDRQCYKRITRHGGDI